MPLSLDDDYDDVVDDDENLDFVIAASTDELILVELDCIDAMSIAFDLSRCVLPIAPLLSELQDSEDHVPT